MNGLAIVMIMGMCALPLAGVIILVVCIHGDIQSRKEMKRFEVAMHDCEAVHGWTFTSRLLDRCSNDSLPVINRIELLEHFAGKKDIHVAIRERMAK